MLEVCVRGREVSEAFGKRETDLLCKKEAADVEQDSKTARLEEDDASK